MTLLELADKRDIDVRQDDDIFYFKLNGATLVVKVEEPVSEITLICDNIRMFKKIVPTALQNLFVEPFFFDFVKFENPIPKVER